ncbi:hypothetical protein KKE60_07105, partial [Patescibacteria group bacterium]|nr:hypothetical protein [Patescibacteria group bacterium]
MIPNPQINTSPPKASFQIWKMSVQEHKAKKAGLHYDLRLLNPSTGIAHSWAIRKWPPVPGEKLFAAQSGDHTPEAMTFQGELPKGYGAGKVSLVDYDDIEVLESTPNKISFNKYTGSEVQRYALVRMQGTEWLILNITPTGESRSEVPQYKRSYPEIKINDIDYHNQNQVIAEKVDGAHVTIALRPEKRVDVFSYRPSKKRPTFIDHSFKTELYRIKSPRSLGKTILRAELFAVDPRTKRPLPSAETGGIINSGTWKSRESQIQKGKLEHLIYDIDVYKGKDVSNLPYAQKLQLLNIVKQELPNLNIVKPVGGVVQKRNLVDEVVSGKNRLSQEGVVVYDLTKSIPEKAKITRDLDVYFHSPIPPTPGSRLEQMGAVGGFLASRDPGGIPNIRVGGGLSDELRKDIAQNPLKYKNLVAKIYAQEELKSGKLRMPVFKEFRTYEQWPSKQASKSTPAEIAWIKLKNLGKGFVNSKNIRHFTTEAENHKYLTDYMERYNKLERKIINLTQKKASVLDPIQPTLDPELWDENQKLRLNIKKIILQIIKNVLGPETSKVSTVKLIGAITTKNWTPSTDIDVNVGFYPFEDPNNLRIYSDMFKQSNPHPLSGSKHVINLFATIDTG